MICLQMASAASAPPVTALVKIDDAEPLSFEHKDLLSMDKGGLLRALTKDDCFKNALSSVDLVYSIVSVFRAATDEAGIATKTVQLAGFKTIGKAWMELLGETQHVLVIHVKLPEKSIFAAAGERCCWHWLSCCDLGFTLVGAAGAGAGGAAGESPNCVVLLL